LRTAHTAAKGSPEDFMVLVRGKNDGHVLEAAFRAADIDYRFIGGQSLWATSHCKDLLATVLAAQNAGDEVAWMRALSMYPGIAEGTARKMWEAGSRQPFAGQALDAIGKEFPQKTGALTGIRAAYEAGYAPTDVVRNTIRALTPIMAEDSDYKENWGSRLKDLELVAQMATKFAHLDKFLASYTINPVHVTEATGEQKPKAVICTIHSAKGLAGRYVFLVATQRGKFPGPRAIEDGERGISEERRVLYVALTRARDRLVLTQTEEAPRWGEDPDGEYFFEGLPASLVVEA
jgi:DNA helicase-2/ATP-dependent DNA helicase PcrA